MESEKWEMESGHRTHLPAPACCRAGADRVGRETVTLALKAGGKGIDDNAFTLPRASSD